MNDPSLQAGGVGKCKLHDGLHAVNVAYVPTRTLRCDESLSSRWGIALDRQVAGEELQQIVAGVHNRSAFARVREPGTGRTAAAYGPPCRHQTLGKEDQPRG